MSKEFLTMSDEELEWYDFFTCFSEVFYQKYYPSIGKMKRLYMRNKGFKPIGWYCPKCKLVILD